MARFREQLKLLGLPILIFKDKTSLGFHFDTSSPVYWQVNGAKKADVHYLAYNWKNCFGLI